MILKSYSVFDSATGVFTTPFMVHNDQAAMRSCVSAMDGTLFGEFPEQFSLFHIGEFETASGVYSPSEHRLVTNLSSLVPQTFAAKQNTIQFVE